MLSKRTVLIVEDEEAIMLALQRILELGGEYEAITASDGVRALERLQTVVPDLIISDISMPNMDGLELCRRVRENPVTQSVPFIFLTGKKEKLVEGISLGGDDFLLKPFNVDEVLVKMEAIFRRLEKTREQAGQHKGRIEERSVDELIDLCLKEKLSGTLILQQEGEVGTIVLDNGDITDVVFGNLRADEALDALRKWRHGNFVIRPVRINLKVETHSPLPEADVTGAIEITNDVWWVGASTTQNGVLKNSYLRCFKSPEKNINLWAEPGAPAHFNEIADKIAHVIKDISKVTIYTLPEATPDVCLNSMFLKKINARAICMTSKATWKMARFYDINPKSVKIIDDNRQPVIRLASGQRLKFIPIPFCAEPGAFMTYDIEKQVLFSGLLFSSDSESTDDDPFYSTDSDWPAMRRFHLQRLANDAAFKKALNVVRKLAPQWIAPRYGKIIPSGKINFFMERLFLLPIGAGDKTNTEGKALTNAMNALLTQIQGILSLDDALRTIQKNPRLSALLDINGNKIQGVFSCERSLFNYLIHTLIQNLDTIGANQIKTSALKVAFDAGLELPDFEPAT